jgi:hypothetical protein
VHRVMLQLSYAFRKAKTWYEVRIAIT